MNNISSKFHVRSLCVFCTLLFAGMPLRGDGFRNPPEGAAAQGRMGGRIAYTEDASTVSHNPANLVDLREPGIYGSLSVGYGKTEYSGADGASAETTSPWYVIPGVFYSHPLGENPRRVLGVGLYSPYGRSSRMDEEGPFRFHAPYYTELRTVALSAALAQPLGDTWSVGYGASLLYADLDLRQMFPWGLALGNPALPDGRLLFSGDGIGVGAFAALSWRPDERQRVALTLRSPVKVKFEGDVTVQGRPGAPGVPGANRSDFETEITFPMIVALAYGVRVTDRLLLEANVEWVGHSAFDRLEIEAGENNPLLPSSEIVADWKDNMTYGLSAEWIVSPGFVLRGGAVYLESPVPSRTMLPTTAEQDQWVLAVGAGLRRERYWVDAAYSLGIFSGRKVRDSDNPAFNGDYDFEAHLLSVGLGMNF